MRGTFTDLIYYIGLKDEYDYSNAEKMGWNSTFVLLMCLPVFFSILAYAGILFYEVAAKKELISSKPLAVSTTSAKYADTTGNQPSNPTGGPTGIPTLGGAGNTGATNINPGMDGTNLGGPTGTTNPPALNPGIGLAQPPGTTTGALNQPPTTTGAVASDANCELYIYEELLIYMMFHLIGLAFCVQPALYKRGHNAVGVVIAWLHFALLGGYTFVAVH